MPTLPTTDVITVTPPSGPPVTRRATADPRTEYMASGAFLWLPALLQALPRYIDDVTRDFGRDLYERMAWDPAVQSATRLLRESAVAAPVHCPPTVDGVEASEGHPEYAAALRIADFCTHNLSHLQPGIKAVLFELSEAVLHGHALAEQVYTLTTLDPAIGPQLVLRAVKVKPPDRYAFVVDPYGNQPGVQYAPPGQSLAGGTTVLAADNGTLVNFLPRRKYVLFTHWPQHSDPRGRSIARAAYHAWWFKRQTWVEFLRYMATFASAMLWATTAPGAQPDPATGTTPEAATLTALETMRNGGVGVGPAGATLTAVQVQGEGRAFLSAIDLANHEITTAILMATRATMEAKNGSKADSGTAQDVVELGVTRLQGDLAAVIAQDMLAPLVLYNYGPDALRYLPKVGLGLAERHDFPSEATAMAALAGTPVLHRSMLPGARAMLGLPPADPAQEAADYDQKAALTAQLTQNAQQQPQEPPTGPPADTKDEAPANG